MKATSVRYWRRLNLNDSDFENGPAAADLKFRLAATKEDVMADLRNQRRVFSFRLSAMFERNWLFDDLNSVTALTFRLAYSIPKLSESSEQRVQPPSCKQRVIFGEGRRYTGYDHGIR